ncbi:MAG: hypothetical protein ACI9GZ_001854, partial [Bacteroidia bacterium]
MKYKVILVVAVLLSSSTVFSQSKNKSEVKLNVNDADNKVDVMVDGKLFTSYIYPDNVKKPVLWPIMSQAGNMLTRS